LSKCKACKKEIETLDDHDLSKHDGQDRENLLERIVSAWYGRGDA
jgi:hypothetical protein